MKKKVLSMLLAAVMLLTLCESAFANTAGVAWIAALDKESVTNDVDQTVTLTIAPSAAVTLDAFDYIVNYPGTPVTVDSVICSDNRINFSSGDLNLQYSSTQAKVLFGGADDAENISDVDSIGTVVFTVPEGTPAGTYSFSVSEINASKDYGTPWSSKEQSNTVTLTVTEPEDEPPVAPGYSVALPESQSVIMNETTALTVNLSSGDTDTYNSYYFELSYDSSKLEYISATEGAYVDSSIDGKLTVTGYGSDRGINTPVTVNFKSKATGDAAVTLTKANVDKAANAAVRDAAEATITNAETTIHIGGYSVSLPEGFSGDTVALPGENYTFSASDKHYDYTLTATMDGQAAEIVDNQDGTFTINNIRGALVITQTGKNAKTYNVTLSGEGTLTDGNTATYLQDYHFARENEAGYTYSVSITIGGAGFTGYSVSGTDYTIPAASVIGDIAIAVTKTAIPSGSFSVTVEGNGAGDAAVSSNTITSGGSAVLTLTPVSGYKYTVTATMAGVAVTPTESENKYTVANVIGNVVFTVTKTQIPDTISVNKYLELDSKTMWLVKATGTLDEGGVFAYGDTPMYYSEKYNAYCWLVISDKTEVEVKAVAETLVSKKAAETIAVEYSGDVNGTKLVDVNDAQLIWNMYNVHYKTFEECAMLKFLSADVNGDATVNTGDAAAVINIVLHSTTD